MTRSRLPLLPLLFALSFLLLSPARMTAQRQGDLELSLSGTAGSASTSSTSTVGGVSMTSEAKGEYATLAMRTGIFFTRQVSIEPEVLWTAMEGVQPVYSVAGNVLYNLQSRGAHVIPFALLGYGLGNGIPTFGRISPSERLSSDWDVSHINAGLGVRALFDRQASLRIEYRFSYYTRSTSSTLGGIKYDTDLIHRDHALMIGLSLFLP